MNILQVVLDNLGWVVGGLFGLIGWVFHQFQISQKAMWKRMDENASRIRELELNMAGVQTFTGEIGKRMERIEGKLDNIWEALANKNS